MTTTSRRTGEPTRQPAIRLRLPENPTAFDLTWFTVASQVATALYGPPARIIAYPPADRTTR